MVLDLTKTLYPLCHAVTDQDLALNICVLVCLMLFSYMIICIVSSLINGDGNIQGIPFYRSLDTNW